MNVTPVKASIENFPKSFFTHLRMLRPLDFSRKTVYRYIIGNARANRKNAKVKGGISSKANLMNRKDPAQKTVTKDSASIDALSNNP